MTFFAMRVAYEQHGESRVYLPRSKTELLAIRDAKGQLYLDDVTALLLNEDNIDEGYAQRSETARAARAYARSSVVYFGIAIVALLAASVALATVPTQIPHQLCMAASGASFALAVVLGIILHHILAFQLKEVGSLLSLMHASGKAEGRLFVDLTQTQAFIRGQDSPWVKAAKVS